MNSELNFFNKSSLADGVYILTPVKNDFEDLYIKVRSKEKRVYTDEELKLLPFASDSNAHKKEWELRAKSFLRFKQYLKTKNAQLNFLDLGCGNGWFCGQLLKFFNHNYYCFDINLTELKQGKKVFGSDQIKFIYADVFADSIPDKSFDLITINAAVQYFQELKTLLNRLLNLLSKDGEIHIIDSPFYKNTEADNAKRRTFEYYSSIGFPKTANFYFHHSWNELTGFNYKLLYYPSTSLNKIKKIFGLHDSPFPWVVIKK